VKNNKNKSTAIADIFILDTENIYESQLVQNIFDIVEIFVTAIDLDGNITLINKKGKEILGLENEEVIGMNFIDKFVKRETQDEVRKIFDAAKEGTQIDPDKTLYYLKSLENQIRIIEAKNIFIRRKNKEILGILISGEDVTQYLSELKNLQKDINLYRILANNIPEINLFLFDLNLQFILAEGSEMKNKGLFSSDFEGKSLNEIPDEELKELWKPLFLSALKGEETSTEYSLNKHDYLIRVLPVQNEKGYIYSGLAITQNVSKIKKTEKNLTQAKKVADNANKAKSDFLAQVSHEIRTPLNAIMGFIEQLYQTKLDARQKEFVNILDKSSEHLHSLINDILVLSKIEARQINFESLPFKIEYTINYVFNSLKAKAEEKHLEFTYDIDNKLTMVLHGDSFRLQQILLNMLNNAIKFTQTGYIELKCFIIYEDEDEVKVRFDIIDTGIGIEAEKLKLIFQNFTQANSGTTKKYGGTGLGLPICKSLIELQNGYLSVRSQKNMGTTFSFVLPFIKSKETNFIPKDFGTIDSKKLKNIKVLLVDDDNFNRLLGLTILRNFKCRYDFAINGTEAIKKIRNNNYDVILLDIHMPDISGVEVAKFLRIENNDSTTKILAVTAAVMKDDIKNYYNAGIDDFIVKPYKEIYLFNKLCDLLNIKNDSYFETKEEIILKEEISPRPYNLSELRKMTTNTSEMIEMLNTFIDNSENAISDFQHHLQNKKWKKIGETAHKILPSFKHLEIHEIITKLTKIKNKTLIHPDYKSAEETVKIVIEEITDILSDIKTEIEDLS